MSRKPKPSSQPKANNEPKQTRTNQSLIYLGPSITGVVRHATTFSNGILSEALTMVCADTPAIRRLIVQLDEAPSLIKELNKKQSATANVYRFVAQKYNKQEVI